MFENEEIIGKIKYTKNDIRYTLFDDRKLKKIQTK